MISNLLFGASLSNHKMTVKKSSASATNSYEETRQKRLDENKKRFQDLGILKISKNLSDLTKPAKHNQLHTRPKQSRSYNVVEPRRSTRERNPIVSYVDELDIGIKERKRSKLNSSWTRYLQRPLNETRFAAYEERAEAIKRAEDLMANLESGYPSFIKSMVRSHVYSCFWLGLPSRFCEDHLPKTVLNMVLEDENNEEYEAIYIGARTGLSGGWKAFALDHKLDDGDALVFELTEPARFKIYTVKAFPLSSKGDDAEAADDNKGEEDLSDKKTSKRGRKKCTINDTSEDIKPTKEEKSSLESDTKDVIATISADTNEKVMNPPRRSKRLR